MKKKIFIDEMHCSHCADSVRECLNAIDGVQDVDVSLENKAAVVTLSKEIDDEVFIKAIDDVGFDAFDVISIEK